jgi:hypothetical protein
MTVLLALGIHMPQVARDRLVNPLTINWRRLISPSRSAKNHSRIHGSIGRLFSITDNLSCCYEKYNANQEGRHQQADCK